MQLDLLWKYMQADMEADRFENEMRKAPNRQKLIKHRNFLLEQQNNMKKIEGDIAAMRDRMEAVRDDYARLEGLLSAQMRQAEENPPKSIEDAEKQTQQTQKLLDSLSRYEQELQKMHKDAEVRDRQQKEIRVRAAKAKVEYDEVKKVYDAEFKADSDKLAQLKAKVTEESKVIDPVMLEKYNAKRQHSMPPMALLVGDQCGGCYMSLPSVTLRKLHTGEEIVECDNCGRIIYCQEKEQ